MLTHTTLSIIGCSTALIASLLMGLELSSAHIELQKEGTASCSFLTQLHSIQNKLGGQEVLANKGLMKKTGTV